MRRRKVLLTLMVTGLIAAVTAVARGDNALREQMLRVLPQADLNQDGKISESEESMVRRQALKRFPQLDRDSDGKLSDTEMRAMLRSAAQRAARNQPLTEKTGSDASPKAMEAKVRDEMGLVVEKDIAYRTDTGQPTNRLDFIHPKRKVYERAPLLVYIHGGGNTGGSKNVIYNKGDLIIKELTSQGIAIASIDYRLLGKDEEVGFHQLFQDCKDALRFLAQNSDRFKIDPHRMITWGTSAGGSKALLCALTKSDFLPGEVMGEDCDHTVIGGISFFGATTYMVPELWQKRLERFPNRSQTKAAMIMKPSGGMTVDEIRTLVSPDQHLASTSPPILLVHGDNDPVVPAELSEHLHQLGQRKGADVKFVKVKNAGHGFASVRGKEASMTWDDSQQLVVEQVQQWLRTTQNKTTSE